LARLLVGNQVQQAVHVAARLGIADLLDGGPRPVEALAREAGAHPDALRRLLRALAPFGVFAEDDDGRFRTTPAAALLRRGAPGGMRAFALWSGGVSYRVFGALEHSVRTGEPAFERLFGAPFFDYLAAHPDDGAVFDEMMAGNTAGVAPLVAGRDFSAARTVVDVGGGRGELLSAVLRAHPHLRGVLVEHPRLLDAARAGVRGAGLADRCDVVAGDVMDTVPPGGDVYVLKSVLHGLDDAGAARALSACRRAMGDGGTLLLVELVLPPGNEPFPGKLMDLLMLVGGRGRERSEAELRVLLDGAGFRLAGVESSPSGYSVLQAGAARRA
ncbi:methyltransferase, partial [Longimicrobium sp.]|uniref:methyltransferase n=1 Tax=Longimicrobium sp. TaxID=2029185 RepID=UPI002E360370